MSKSRIAIATLITVSVLGSFYYHSRPKKQGKDTIYEDFVESLPITIDGEDDFLSNLFKNATDLVPSTFEEFKEKMNALYPAFERQLESIRNMYSSFWDYLFLEDFKNIVKESLDEDADVIMHPEVEQDAVVREGQDLSELEKDFVRARRQKIKAAFAFFIGVEEHEVDVEDIPNISIASSGGGYRAMIACSGYMHAFSDTGLLDCVTYMAGVSGSTWAMSQFYSSLTNASVKTLKDHLSSRIHTHIANLSNFLTVLNASRHNAKILLHGVIQRYHQQNGTINLVDIFGMLLGGTLLTKKVIVDINRDESYSETISIEDGAQKTDNPGTVREEGGEEVKPKVLHKNEIKLSKQQKYFADGSLPMPIYCAVRHEVDRPGITKRDTMTSELDEEYRDDDTIKEDRKDDKDDRKDDKEDRKYDKEDRKDDKEDRKDDKEDRKDEESEKEELKDLWQWYEFTPYEMGSEEINAWIPIWSFGRKFEKGKNIERLPEQSIGVLMGMFGSAFVASLAHFYQEIRLLLPESAVKKADEMIASYKSSVSTIHPISPASFPNPFYKMTTKVQTKDDDHEEVLRSKNLVSSQQIELMDAGMDNNIPFYPLLRKGRDVDIIISIDSSADIQDAPHFDRAEGYVKRRGIKGWPKGAGWPKKKETDPIEVGNTADQQHQKYSLNTCTVFSSESTETTPENESVKTTYPKNTNPITLVYFPLIVNDNYDPEFDPQTAEFCSTWNFVYTKEQVNKLHDLSSVNVKNNIEKVRKTIKDVWLRKKKERLNRQ